MRWNDTSKVERETVMDQIINIFLSYAHENEQLRNELVKHLSVLKNEGFANTWSDSEIRAGSEWQQDISEHLATADLILLLVSADFLASVNCYEGEMKQALERHAAGQTRVVPILLRAVDWESAPFDNLQVLPFDAIPVDSQPNRDEAFQQIARSIRGLVEEMLVERGQEHFTMERYTQSVQAYRNALKLRPTLILARQGLAKALFSLKQYEEALEEYKKAIRFNARIPALHQGKGDVLLELKQYEEALASYNEVLEIDPQDASGYVDKGYTLLRLRRYQGAFTAYEDALRLNPHAASAYGERGKALDELRDFKGDIAAIVEQILPSLQLSQQETSRSSLTPAVKIVPPLGTLLIKYTEHYQGVSSVNWLPSGVHIASSGSAGTGDSVYMYLNIWKASTGRTLWSSSADRPYQIIWSPSDQRFASLYQINNYGSGAKIWDCGSSRYSQGEYYQIKANRRDNSYMKETAHSVAWSPEGLRIASSVYSGKVEIWEATTGNTLDTYVGVTGTAWSPNGNYIASSKSISDGSSSFVSHELVVWEVGTHRVVTNYSLPSESKSLPWSFDLLKWWPGEWSPDGQYLASIIDEGIVIWKIREGHTQLVYSDHAQRAILVKWSPSGKYLASASGRSIHIWEAATGYTSLIYKGHFEDVTSLSWSPDGTRMASGSRDGSIHIWFTMEG